VSVSVRESERVVLVLLKCVGSVFVGKDKVLKVLKGEMKVEDKLNGVTIVFNVAVCLSEIRFGLIL
jgi:hypothetical protein